MTRRLRRTGLFLAAACGLALSCAARADIYTWTDEAGKINVSNLKPPEGVRITRVVRDTPRPPASEVRTDLIYQQQVLALSERVRQLEAELQAPPPPSFAPPPTVVVAPVINVTMPQPVDYTPVQETAPAASCDPSWYGCGAYWGSGFYPYYQAPTVVITRPNPPRRHHRVDTRPHPAPYQFGSVPLAPVGQVVPPVTYPTMPVAQMGRRPGR